MRFRVLVYESPEKLLAEPDPRRYLHTVILTALRDKAERVEVRFGEDGGMLYYRVDGRDWELVPPPDDVYPVLKQYCAKCHDPNSSTAQSPFFASTTPTQRPSMNRA